MGGKEAIEMKFAGLGLGIFFVLFGGALFLKMVLSLDIKYAGYGTAFITWGILLIWWYWGKRNGRVCFNLSKGGHEKLKEVIKEDETSISQIMGQAFSDYYDLRLRNLDSIRTGLT